MARHSSAALRKKSSTPGKRKTHLIDASLKRRTRLLITNGSIPKPTRNLIQYALEIKDRYLAQIVQRVEAGELTIDRLHKE